MQQQPQALTHSLSMDGLIAASSRLNDLMQQEGEALDNMRIGELPKLQDEKLRLTGLLETYQQRLAADPAFLEGVDASTRDGLLLLTEDLAFGAEDNFRKVAAAQAVNKRVLQAIIDVVSEDQRPSTYGRQGQAMMGHDLALSMNLNQRA